MTDYNHKQIEDKWRKKWEDTKINKIDIKTAKNPFFNLMMFPYPSAEGLHIGSVYTFSGIDTFGRFKQMQGNDVFEPIGLDGFGIHSENFAIKIGEHISDVSKRTEKHFYDQLKWTGNMFDWDRTVETYKPNYYKWTQWLFLQLYKKGLAFRKESLVNWDPKDKTVISDEQVLPDGTSERSGVLVEKKQLTQWFFKITDYSERLLRNLNWIDWDNDVKLGQRNWIGKSEGAKVNFGVEVKGEVSEAEKLEIFTTRPDTIFGATFMVIAPEHPILEKFAQRIDNISEINDYKKEVQRKSEIDRTDLNKDKSGVEIKGILAINPVNKKRIPVFVADYVLMNYGTGAIMAVPAHDERDMEFAKKYNIEIIPTFVENENFVYSYLMGADDISNEELLKLEIIIEGEKDNARMIKIPVESIDSYKKLVADKLSPGFWNEFVGFKNYFIFKNEDSSIVEFELNSDTESKVLELVNIFLKDQKTLSIWQMLLSNSYYEKVFTKLAKENLFYINSEFLNQKDFTESFETIIEFFEKNQVGSRATNYKLRDWCVSRQRYWGPPIPMLKENISSAEKSVITVHAYEGTINDHYYKWVHNELVKNEIKSYLPSLPGGAFPKISDWIENLENIYNELSQNEKEALIINGRSLGGWAVLKFAEKHKVRKLILVAPTTQLEFVDEERIISLLDNDEKKFESLIEFIGGKDGDLDVKKINENVGEIVLMLSKDDPYIPFESTKKYFSKNFENISVREYKNSGHFGSENGYSKFEDLLGEILSDEKWMPVKEYDLPVLLPEIAEFEKILPDGSGKGPLEKLESFWKISETISRETDVSDPFVDSCWYFLRYPFTDNDNQPFEFVERSNLGSISQINEDFKNEVVRIYDLLESKELYPMIGGNLMLFGLNGFAFKETLKVDLFFSSKTNAQIALEMLKNNGYIINSEEYKYVCKKDGMEIIIVFDGFEKTEYFGYKVQIFDKKMRILDPRIMKKIYETKENVDELKIQIIEFWENQPINKWFPINYYIGGKEHTVLHLLYARFITMVLNDMGYIDFEEPFTKFYGHGLITKDGAKMSKSKGNVINPDEYFDLYGADSVRMYLRFLGPFDQGGDWRDTGMKGMRRFTKKLWEIYEKIVLQHIVYGSGVDNMSKLHQTIKWVGEDLDQLRFNTAVAKIMELVNWYKENEEHFDKQQTMQILKALNIMISPMMPYIAEELWEIMNKSEDQNWSWSKENSVHSQSWPEFDEKVLFEQTVTIIVQQNGKLKDRITIVANSTQEDVMKVVQEKLSEKIELQSVKKIVFVPNRIINFIV